MNRSHLAIIFCIIIGAQLFALGMYAAGTKKTRNAADLAIYAIETATYAATIDFKTAQGLDAQMDKVINRFYDCYCLVSSCSLDEAHTYVPLIMVLANERYYIYSLNAGFSGVNGQLYTDSEQNFAITNNSFTKDELGSMLSSLVLDKVNNELDVINQKISTVLPYVIPSEQISIDPNPTIIAVYVNPYIDENEHYTAYIYQSTSQIAKK